MVQAEQDHGLDGAAAGSRGSGAEGPAVANSAGSVAVVLVRLAGGIDRVDVVEAEGTGDSVDLSRRGRSVLILTRGLPVVQGDLVVRR